MAWLKKNLLFTVIMVLLACVLVAELWVMMGRRQRARDAEAEFQAKVEEHKRLAAKPILPHENNVALLQAEVERQRDEADQFHQVLRGNEEIYTRIGQPPRSRSDAFFDIASFIDEYRQRAVQANISIPENEYFGFAAYTAAGPEERLIPGVFKQRVIMAHILDRLFEVEPIAILGVQRPGEAGAAAAPDARRGLLGGAGAPAEGTGGTFRIDAPFSAAIPDVAEALPFQVTFTGRTSTLRAFLNELGSFDLPLMVRTVEATPLGDTPARGEQPAGGARRRPPAPGRPAPEEEATPGPEAGQQENVSIVSENVSRFTVAMEFLDVRPLERAR